jgi:succinoglycan biosynthesis protein ExoO
MAAWQAEERLAASVTSALAQQDVALEVIVVDDASRDGTRAAAERLAAADPRVRVLGLERNGGPAAARNAALDAARGDWVAVLDADDAMRPDRLARLMAFGRETGADIVCDDLALVAEGAPEGPAFLGHAAGDPPQNWDMEAYLAGNQARPGVPSLGFLKPLFRRDFLQAHGLRYDESLRNGEDFHLVLAALAAGASLWFLPGAGYLYTTRTGSVSNRLDPAHAAALAHADAAFLDRHGARLSPRARDLMRERMGRIADFAAAEGAMQALKARRPAAAVRTLAKRPQAAGRFLTQVSEAVRKRLGTSEKQ